jgi:adenylate cyclase
VNQSGISRSRTVVTLAFSILVCLVVAGAASTRFFDIVELNGFDRLIGVQGEPGPIPEIAFVDITDATVKEIGAWPIPRGVIAQVIRRIAQGRPELIGLDMQVSEKRSPAEDQALAAALDEAGNVVVPVSLTERGILTEPLPEFRAAALDVGLVNMYPDEDGAIRRVPLALRVRREGGDVELLGFAAALATNHSGAPLTPGRPGTYRLGAAEIHLDGRSGAVPSILIGDWAAPGMRLDVLEVLQPSFVPGALAGKVVIVGESSKAGKDIFETPLYGRRGLVSLPEVHAAALASLLRGRTVRTLGGWRLWTINLVAAVLALAFVMHGRPAWAVPAVLALAFLVFWLAWWLLTRLDTWMPFVSTEAVLMLSLSAALGYRFLRGNEQERMLKELFGRYVSSEVLHEVLRHPEGVAIEGQERTASILFADIRGFTATSAGQPPRDVIAWVNDYFAAMSEVIERNGGFLNKFIGDGLMVVFGVPVSKGDQEDAERAVRAALQMLERLEGLNRENAARAAQGMWRPPIRIGVGIHTGPLAAGNVGSPRRMEYSVIGETVNLAARLESATRAFEGVDLVISPATEKLVRDRFVTEVLGTGEAKGFRERVQMYTVRSELPVSAAGASS